MAHLKGSSLADAFISDVEFTLATPSTVNIGGTQFVYTTNNGRPERAIRVFEVNNDGSLNFLSTYEDSAETALGGAWEMETFTIGNKTFLATVAQEEDGLAIFELSDEAPYLTHVDSVFDTENSDYQLDGARYLAVHQIEGNTFLTTTARPFLSNSEFDRGISVFQVADDGTLTLADTFDQQDIDDAGARSIAGGWPSDTFEVNGKYYFAVGDSYGRKFAIMEIDPNTGELSIAVDDAGISSRSAQIAVHTVGTTPYLFVPSDDVNDSTLYVYTYDGSSDVQLVTSIPMEIPDDVFRAEVTQVYETGDNLMIVVGARGKSAGILTFDFHVATETLDEIEWLPGPASEQPETHPLQDTSWSDGFTIDGISYALATSDDTGTTNVYEIGGGYDMLVGTSGDDLIEGFGGGDSLFGGSGDDTIYGGNGNDSILGGSGADILDAGAGDDTVATGSGSDYVDLGAGDDYVEVGGGVETFIGGEGTDYISYFASSNGITANLAGDTISGSWAVNDTISGFEGISGSETGNDRITGTDGANIIRTFGGNDRVFAGKGSDVVELGDGNDYVRVGGGVESFDGGDGNDWISYYSSSNGITANLAEDTVSGSWAVNDTIKSFESISGSRTGNDNITGTDGANVIRTYGGNDRVYAGKGSDDIELGSGNDYVRVGGGAENFDGGSGNDYISYYSSSNGIFIDLREDEVSGSWAVNDTIKDFESASGSRTGDDTMFGTEGANTFRSYGGDDTLYGRGGSDELYGGDGEDILNGGAGGGTDLLYGGADADVFEFNSGDGIDIIKDFEDNIDTIQLSNFDFDAGGPFDFATQVGSDVVFEFGDDGTLTVEDATIGQLMNDLEIV